MNKNISTNDLLVGDRNAILIAARVSGYGNMYETNVSCPSCAAVNQYAFDLNDIEVYAGDNQDTTELTSNNDGTFTTLLPRTKVEVTFRLLSGRDEKALISQVENARKRKLEENSVTRQLKQIIIAVNGDSDQKNINYVVDNVPTSDARHLRLMYKIAAPDVDMTQNFECSECGYVQDMEVPLTADFFWPDR